MNHTGSSSIGDDRKPVPLPPPEPRTPDDIRRHASALMRKQMCRDMAQRFTATRSAD